MIFFSNSQVLANSLTDQNGKKNYSYSLEQLVDFKDLWGIEKPVSVKFIDDKYYLATQAGKLYSFSLVGNEVIEFNLILDIADIVAFDLDMGQDGLLDFNLDNNFESNGIFYLSYSSNNQSSTATEPNYNCKVVIDDLVDTGWTNYTSEKTLELMIESGVFDSDNLMEIEMQMIAQLRKACDYFPRNEIIPELYGPGRIGFYEVTMFIPGANPKAYKAKNILTLPDFYPIHSGGSLSFDKNNNLYIALGDGGGPGRDGLLLSQNTTRLEGSILRVIPNTNFEESEPYSIPLSNPFINNNKYLPEIWAYGFRNPFRSYFDRELDVMILSDVGDMFFEELNIVKKGQNFGWPFKEGEMVGHYIGFMPGEVERALSYESNNRLDQGINNQFTDPLVTRPHLSQTEGDLVSCALTAVLYNNSKKYLSLKNSIINVDWCGSIYSTTIGNTNDEISVVQDKRILSNVYGITNVIFGPSDELLLLSFDGKLFRLIEKALSIDYDLSEDVEIVSYMHDYLKYKDFISTSVSGEYNELKLLLQSKSQNLDDNNTNSQDCFLEVKYVVAGEDNYIMINDDKFYGYKASYSGEDKILNFNRGLKKIKANINQINNNFQLNLGFFVKEGDVSFDSRLESIKFLCSD